LVLNIHEARDKPGNPFEKGWQNAVTMKV